MNNIKNIFFSILFVAASLSALAQDKIVILHTNDMHSQIEPIDKRIGGVKGGKGGMVRVATYINEVIAQEPNTIVLDAGDFSQGSIYYSMFSGETEIDFMNACHYDAGTLGNHEFDKGMENLANLIKRANFTFVNCNYDLTNTPLNGLVKPYIVIDRTPIRVGIIGISPNNLRHYTFDKNIEGIIFKDTYSAANETADYLRNVEKCDLIVCVSHCGWTSDNETIVCDSILATKSHNIDIIIGGHTHTYMERPKEIPNLDGKIVYINQTGSNTTNVGRMEIGLTDK